MSESYWVSLKNYLLGGVLMFWPDGRIPNTAIIRKQTFWSGLYYSSHYVHQFRHLLRHLVDRGVVLSKKTSCRELLRRSEHAKMADHAAPR